MTFIDDENDVAYNILTYNYNKYDVCLNPDIIIDENTNKGFHYCITTSITHRGWTSGCSYSCHSSLTNTGGGSHGCYNGKEKGYNTQKEAILAEAEYLLKEFNEYITNVPQLKTKEKSLLPLIVLIEKYKADCFPKTPIRIIQPKTTIAAAKPKPQIYTGSKNANGVPQWIINNIPLHKNYYELFAGSAVIFFKKRPADNSLLIEKDYSQYKKLFKNITEGPHPTHGCGIHYLKITEFTSTDFIYLDPPYPFSSRRKGRKYYNEEMSDADHKELLQLIKTSTAMIMISTRQNELYSRELKDWRKKEFRTSDRAGACTEIVYMNYPEPTFLHEYTYIGDGYQHRQQLKRKAERFASKLTNLQAYERHIYMLEMIKSYKDELYTLLKHQ